MKKLIIIAAIFLFTAGNADAMRRSYAPVSFNYFYYELSPYGEWIQLDEDLIVWRPTTVDYRWSPYSIGTWTWTEYGWYWDSFEPFGWITYHYGRWIYDDFYGWIWFPDYDWAPAWVEWRYDDYYIGWAPLPPYARFRVNVGIVFTYNWHPGYHHWHFISYRHFGRKRMHNHYVSGIKVRTIFGRTKVLYKFGHRYGRVVNNGISRRFVELRAGRKIQTRDLVFTNSRTERLNNRANVIRVYEPDRKTISRYSSVERKNVKVAKRTSVVRDKIAVTRTNERSQAVRKNDIKRNKDVNSIRKNYSPDKLAGKEKQSKSSSPKIIERKTEKKSVYKSNKRSVIKKSAPLKNKRIESSSASKKRTTVSKKSSKVRKSQTAIKSETKRKTNNRKVERNSKRSS